MRPLNALLFLVAIAPLALADVQFVSPAAGVSVPGGTAFSVTWSDSGTAPSISDLTAFQLFLFTGSNASPQQLYSLGNAAFTAGSSLSVTIPTTIGGSTANA